MFFRSKYRDYATAAEICASGIGPERYLRSVSSLVADRAGCTAREVRITDHMHAMVTEFGVVFDSSRWTGRGEG